MILNIRLRKTLFFHCTKNTTQKIEVVNVLLNFAAAAKKVVYYSNADGDRDGKITSPTFKAINYFVASLNVGTLFDAVALLVSMAERQRVLSDRLPGSFLCAFGDFAQFLSISKGALQLFMLCTMCV